MHHTLAGATRVAGGLRYPELVHVSLHGWGVDGIVPAGKHLLLRFPNGRSLHTHLHMDGAWHVYRAGARWWLPAHDARVVLTVPDLAVAGFRLHDLRLLSTRDEWRLVGHPDRTCSHSNGTR
ncbi:MAG: DNA-formamidopyrimidine glycosylase family protein [Streptosporangiales bacterium]